MNIRNIMTSGKPALAIIVLGMVGLAYSSLSANFTNSLGNQTNVSSPLRIVVAPKDKHFPAENPFVVVMVSVEIMNVSSTNFQFTMWNCSREYNWTTDNASIRTGYELCTDNTPIDIKLAPGQSYRESHEQEMRIGLMISKSALTNNLSFCLGLTPNRWSNKDFTEALQKDQSSPPWKMLRELGTNTYWSDKVTLNLVSK